MQRSVDFCALLYATHNTLSQLELIIFTKSLYQIEKSIKQVLGIAKTINHHILIGST